MEESTVLEEFTRLREARGEARGRLEEARAMILRLGKKKLGAASASVESALTSIDDLERIERIGDRLLEVNDWTELLSAP